MPYGEGVSSNGACLVIEEKWAGRIECVKLKGNCYSGNCHGATILKELNVRLPYGEGVSSNGACLVIEETTIVAIAMVPLF